jgi:hypothetical protein
MRLNDTLGYNINQLTTSLVVILISHALLNVNARMFTDTMSFSCVNHTLVFCREMSNNNLEGSGISNNLPPNLQRL